MIEKFAFKNQDNWPLVSVFCLVLAGCGGGGDAPTTSSVPASAAGTVAAALPVPVAAIAAALPVSPPATLLTPALPTSSPTMPLAPAQPVSSPATPSSAPAGGASVSSDFSCGLNGAAGIEAEVIQRINALRAAGAVCGATSFSPAAALAWNTTLLAAAKGHSADMAQKNYFSHTSLDGRSASQRVSAAGYSWSAVGENIAAGQQSVALVMAGWTDSPGHCRNLMNPNYRDVAVACVRSDASDYGLYWTMNLGRSR